MSKDEKIISTGPFRGKRITFASTARIEEFTQIASDFMKEIFAFALHLLVISRLPALLFRLAEITPRLLILTPHKRPEIKAKWGWQIEGEVVLKRVRGRLYRRL